MRKQVDVFFAQPVTISPDYLQFSDVLGAMGLLSPQGNVQLELVNNDGSW